MSNSKGFNEALASKKSRGWNTKGQLTPARAWNTRVYLRQLVGLYWDIELPGSRTLNIVGSGAIIINWGAGSTYQVTFESLVYTTVYADPGRFDLVIKGDVHRITRFSNAGYPSLCGSVKGFGNLESLSELELVGGNFTGELAVAGCPLTRLLIPGSAVSGDFDRLPATLTEIDLSGATGLRGELLNISRFAGLRRIDLSGSGVQFNDYDIPTITTWSDGIHLNVSNLSLSEEGVISFLNLCFLANIENGVLNIAGNNSGLSAENVHVADDLRQSYNWTVYCNVANPLPGDDYHGGILAYLYQEGDAGFVAGEFHGIVLAPADLPPMAWSNVTDAFCGAAALALGQGNANTDAIIAQAGHTGSAAKYCHDYVSPDGFSDFCLPTPNDWLKIEQNSEAIGGFTHPAYWTSAEGTDYGYEYIAYLFYFPYDAGEAYYDSELKSEARSFRPIRYF